MGKGAAIERILAGQERWAQWSELERLESGHAASVDTNLFSPLSHESRTELAGAKGGLLGDGEKPGRIQLLHSSLALVCNVFDPRRGSELGPLGLACGAGAGVSELRLASGGETGPNGLDVLLGGNGARPAGVVADFTEPYEGAGPHACERENASDAEPGGDPLPGCRNLERDLAANRNRFRRLPAGRLLAGARELTRSHGCRKFRLLYLWYDTGCPEAGELGREIDRFRMRVGGEVDFEARSWQEALGALSPAAAPGVAEQLGYLRERYLRDR